MKKRFTLLCCLASVLGCAQIPTNGLTAHYSFQGSAYTQDSGPASHHLSYTGTIQLSSGISGGTSNAIVFDGASYGEVNDPAFRSGSISVSAWINCGGLQSYSTIAAVRYNTLNSPYNSYNLYTGSNVGGKACFTLKTSGSSETTLTGTTTLNMGDWYFVTATYDSLSGKAKLYVNGGLEATTTLAGSLAYNASNNPFIIGNISGTVGNGFMGLIDEVLVYDRALSAIEINTIYSTQNQSLFIMEPVEPLKNYEEARINFNSFSNDNALKRINAGQSVLATGPNISYTTDRWGNTLGALAAANNSYLSASNTLYNTMDTAITCLGWVKRTASTTYGLFLDKRYSNSTPPYNSYALGCGSGYVGYENRLMGTISTSTTNDVLVGDTTDIVNGNWYFVAMTYSSGQQSLKYYVNGTLVDTKTVSGTIMQNTAAGLFVGRGYPTTLHDWNGSVDDIRIFSKALTETEIDSIMSLSPNTSGLISYYPMGYYPHDAISGFDLGRNTNQVTDRFNNVSHATNFDGSSYIIPDFSPLHKSDTAITIEGWIYRTGQQNYSTMVGIRANQTVAPYNSVLLAAGTLTNSKLLGVISTVNNPDVNVLSPSALPLNSWYHVGLTYSVSESKVKLYINGIKVNEVTATGNINYPSNSKLTIGNASSTPLAGHYFIGKIDEIKIYNRAKTEQEFANDFCINNSLSFTSPLSVCYYDSAFTVAATPAGGVLSGASLSSNTFDPSAGVGAYDIHYSYAQDGCMNDIVDSIRVKGNPAVSVTANTTDLSAGNYNLTSGIQWYNCGTQTLIPFEFSQTYLPSQTGDYAIVSNDNGCIDTSACVNFVVSPVGLQESAVSFTKAFPNPAHERVTIKAKGANNKLVLYNVLGVEMLNVTFDGRETSFSVLEFPKGIYLLTILSDGVSTTEKLIIE